MYKFRKLKLALAFFSLFILISMVQETYMKYNTTATGTTSFSIARWQIAVNSQDIISNSSITNVITPIIISNEHVKEGTLAPLSTGYFDLVIDYTNVETSFEYTVTSSIPSTSSVTDLKITGYSEDGQEVIPLSGGSINLNKQVNLTETNRTKNLRIYISWVDGEGETMNNSQDTAATLNNETANLNVSINFKQKVN